MRLFYLFIIFTFLAVPTAFASFNCDITTTLRVGSAGEQVKCLQTTVGASVDGHFGPLTKAAVMTWQSGHELVADGVFGPLSRGVFNRVISGASPVINNSKTVSVQPPKVFSVSPEKVRSGDTVKIYGENFSSTGNTVRLRYAQIEDRFENLPSSDGKVISFVFQPPDVKTMTKEELLNLPSAILNKILDPVQRAGGSIDDLVTPYRNIKNENELTQFLQKNGHTFDELYDKFWVTVENTYGRGSSHAAILTGLRKLSFGSDSLLSKNNFIFSIFNSLSKIFTPQKAYAQTAEGGYNSGVILYCTCGSGYLTYMTDFSNNGGTGDYYWAPGFVPTVGNPFISGYQLGFFTQNSGTCSIYAGTSCTSITANTASLPWGEGL